MSSSVHGPSYLQYRAAHEDFVPAACCDLNPGAARRYAERFGFARFYTGADEMFDQEKPDAVCVIVSESAAAGVGERALLRGLPLLMEKPPGKNAGETRRLRAAAEKTGAPNMTAFNRRFMPVMREGKRQVELSGRPVRQINYSLYRVGRNDEDFSDTAIHAIDAVRFLARSDYREARFTRRDISGFRPQNVILEAVMESGALARITVLPVSGAGIERAEVHCEGCSVFIALPLNEPGIDGAGSVTVYTDGKAAAHYEGLELCGNAEPWITGGFYQENADFFDALRGGTLGRGAFHDALNTMEVKDAYADGTEIWRRGEDFSDRASAYKKFVKIDIKEEWEGKRNE
jgi:predicted dehydrogenase